MVKLLDTVALAVLFGDVAASGCPFANLHSAGTVQKRSVNESAAHLAEEDGIFDTAKLNASSSNGFPGNSCPFMGNRVNGVDGTGPTLDDFYPQRLRVELLDQRHSSPYGSDFNYTEAFNSLNYTELKEDLKHWLTDSQSWWPADYGHYGPQMVRTTWHGAGTYRIADGRGGAGHALQRFLPINSWQDNANTDKTRRLLWPIKQKYGDNITWSDLLVLSGTVALESMGVRTLGFAAGRLDAWEADTDTFWGNELVALGREDRWNGSPINGTGDLASPLADSEAQLIYVNPEGPGAVPDPMGSAREIRITFRRMAMDDEETVALIAGGHTFGKSHGAVSKKFVGPPPANASMEYQGLGWINSAGTGNGNYTTTNGCEGSWVENPLEWDTQYLTNLMDHEWVLTKSPAGAHQWRPKNVTADLMTPDAHLPNVSHPIMMFTSDIALKVDPAYNKIMRKFRDSPKEVFFEAFSRAWYKLTHRDMGPKTRYIGPEVPKEDFIWQDPVPARNHTLVNATDIAWLKSQIRNSTGDLMPYARVAWAAASTFRSSDMRGGANGARVRLSPQKDWEVNRPDEISMVVSKLEAIEAKFNSNQTCNKRVSLADLIVLAGSTAVESAAQKAGMNVTVPFTPGRMDATQNSTDVETFEWLHPVMDGFRNFESGNFSIPAEHFLIDRAQLLSLTAPQLTVLVGGMRSLGMNWDNSSLGVFTDRPGTLSNDFFVNLLNMSTVWRPLDDKKTRFEGVDRESGEHKWYATRSDLVFGHNAQLRAVSEVYGSTTTGQKRFVKDFIEAWNHVMMLDRFDVHP